MRTEVQAFAGGKPPVDGTIRSVPEDFIVDEVLGFELSGEGEHHWLRVRKRGWNTEKVARMLAKFSGVPVRDVGYSGLKDRNAVTSQWFSVRLPGLAAPDWSGFAEPGIEIVTRARHGKKLKRGVHRLNRFRIVVRQLAGEVSLLESALKRIAAEGVPNYFGPQRFGIDGGNLERAREMFAAGREWRGRRHQRSLYLSAARSWLFNAVLSARVAADTWDQPLAGEVFQLDGSRSIFAPEEIDETIRQRLAAFDIHPTGPLWGRGELPSRLEVEALERHTVDGSVLFRDGLEAAGLKQERRALRLPVRSLTWEFPADESVVLAFDLPRGAYATTVLRECINTDRVASES